MLEIEMIRSKHEPSFRCEKIEVLVRPVFPESDGRYCVFLRDGMTQVMTFEGSNEKAVEQAGLLFSIVKAMWERCNRIA